MNKVIELAKQSEIDYELRHDIARAPVWIATDEELEKFAELLIEEALYVVDMPLIERNEIRKHFGIKEEPMPVRDIGLVTTRDWTK